MCAFSVFAVVKTSFIAGAVTLLAASDHFEITPVPLNPNSKLQPRIGVHFKLQH